MQQYDLYINPRKPTVGLYVRRGTGLSDLDDPNMYLMALQHKANATRPCEEDQNNGTPYATWIEPLSNGQDGYASSSTWRHLNVAYFRNRMAKLVCTAHTLYREKPGTTATRGVLTRR